MVVPIDKLFSFSKAKRSPKTKNLKSQRQFLFETTIIAQKMYPAAEYAPKGNF